MEKIFKAKAITFAALLTLQGCSLAQTNAMANFNGVIEWASGNTEYVNVSSSSDFLTFTGTGFSSNSVVIYSRIVGASDNKCEFYVNEPNPKARLVLCGDGEVRLIDSGKTLNVGRLKIFESS